MEVAVVTWFWCWLCSCWGLSGTACAFGHTVQDLPHQGCLSLCQAMPSSLGFFGHKCFSLVTELPKIFHVGPAYCVCAKYLPVCRLSSVPVACTSENLDWGFLGACAIDLGKGKVCSGGRLHSTSRRNGVLEKRGFADFSGCQWAVPAQGPLLCTHQVRQVLLLCALLPLHSHMDKILDNLF